MAQPQMIQRVLGADGRVYTVSTIRLDQKPRGEMWETLVWQGGGCLSRKRSVRYIEYTLSSSQTAAGMAAMAHKSALQMVAMPPDQDDWHMTPQEIVEEKQKALRTYNSFPFA